MTIAEWCAIVGAISTLVSTIVAISVYRYAVRQGERANENDKRFRTVLNALTLSNLIGSGDSAVRTPTVENIQSWLKNNPPDRWV